MALPREPRFSETDARRRQARLEAQSTQDIQKQDPRECAESRTREDLVRGVLDDELPRYSESLDRLGR